MAVTQNGHANGTTNGHANGAATNGHANGNGKAAHEEYAWATRVIHAGSEANEETGAVIPPLSLATTFKQSAVGVHKGFEYTRSLNPNRLAFETQIASLELPHAPALHMSQAERVTEENLPPALAFASGSAATQAIVTALVPTGGHVVSIADVYGGTYRYFTKVAAAQGIKTTFVHLSAKAGETAEAASQRANSSLEAAFTPETKLVWVETPTNPTLGLADIKAVAEIAHRHGALLVVDNTFMSSFYQQPLRLGADIVVHSVTKYLNGHSDVIMGVLVCTDKEALDKLRFYQNAGGAVPGAHDAWLAQRGAKTLGVRMKQHGLNALTVARFLSQQEWVKEVIYPGLEGAERAPVRELAWSQLSPVARRWAESQGYTKDTGFPYGGMVSFRLDTALLKEGVEAGQTSSDFLAALKVFTLAESLGGVESLAELPGLMTHASVSEADRKELGIDNELIRLSVGIEEAEDLLADLEQAKNAASA